MNEKQIEAFHAVMTCGSTTKAAQMLNITQPAVTRLIAGLEDSIQIKLFTRDKRRLHPTMEAISFHNEVEQFFVGMQKLRQATENIRKANSGHLRIACLPSFAMAMVPIIIRKFREIYPNVTISLEVQGSETMMKWFSLQQFSVGIGNRVSEIPGIETEILGNMQGVCILPPGHFLSQKSVIRPSDLSELPFISSDSSSASGMMLNQLFNQERVNRFIVIETRYAATICKSVLSGLGVSIVNPLVAHDYEELGLVIKPFDPPVHFQNTLHYPVYSARSQFIETFVSLLKEYKDFVEKKYDDLEAKTDDGES